MEGGQPSLTLSSPEQLTHVGTAADFGTCRSTRKVLSARFPAATDTLHAVSPFATAVRTLRALSSHIRHLPRAFRALVVLSQDGTPCTAGVNVAKCPFCEYHVAKEYRKMAPRRGGFTDSLLPTGFRRSVTATQPGVLTFAIQCAQAYQGESQDT